MNGDEVNINSTELILKQSKRKSMSYVFLLPMLGLNPDFILPNLINVYLADFSNPQFKNHILLLYDTTGIQEERFNNFKTLVSSIPDFETSYNITAELVMIVFKVPQEFTKDYEIFKQWKYSHLSNKLKRKILLFHGLNSTNDVYKVLYKTEEKRKELSEYLSTLVDKETGDKYELNRIDIDPNAEYADRLYPEREIFGYEDISVTSLIPSSP